jgi:hypothetical protein
MSLVAGTPATLIAHDSRTRELAEYHEIPWVEVAQLDRVGTPAGTYERSDWSAYNAGLASRFEVLTRFLSDSGLEHVAEPGKANPAYDEAIAALELPGPVHTLCAQGADLTDALIGRLRWLSDARDADAERETVALLPAPSAEAAQPTARVRLASRIRRAATHRSCPPPQVPSQPRPSGAVATAERAEQADGARPRAVGRSDASPRESRRG